MPSGKQSKRRRQAAKTPPPPTRTRTPRQASPRVLIAVGVVIAVVLVAIVLGVVFFSGSGSGSSAASASKLPDASDVQQLLRGVPQHGNVLGKPTAPVTLVEYIDLQCPYCQQFETGVMPALVARYVRTGKLRIENRIVAFIGPESRSGREAALAAGHQNKLFNFTQLLYDNQGVENTGWLDDSMVKSAAASIPGLDSQRLLDERSSGAVSDEANAFDAEASTNGVVQTPTILVGKTGKALEHVSLKSPTDEQSVAAAIDAALR